MSFCHISIMLVQSIMCKLWHWHYVHSWKKRYWHFTFENLTLDPPPPSTPLFITRSLSKYLIQYTFCDTIVKWTHKLTRDVATRCHYEFVIISRLVPITMSAHIKDYIIDHSINYVMVWINWSSIHLK